MALVTTPAVVLHTFPYGETSVIARLATPGHGVVSAIAKGAHRPRSPFGARLQTLSEGVAQLYVRQNRELQTLAEFDVTAQRPRLTRDVARYAAAAALAELVMRCSPGEPNPHIFALLAETLTRLSDVDVASLPAAALAGLWRMVGALGFTPAVETCAVEGRALAKGGAAFSVAEGGFVCAVCARTRQTTKLGGKDRAALESLVAGREPVEPIERRHASAHRRLLARFVRRHLAEDRDLKALTFWETLP